MPVGGAHHVISIDERLALLGSTPIDEECCVFKVHHRLREINAKAYEPDLLAIGPYHHGKVHLSFMEKHKLRFLQQFLKRRNETSAERYLAAMREKEERARKFYGDQFHELSTDEFVKMMLLDGCFIIELLRIGHDAIVQHFIPEFVENELVFQTDWMIGGIMRDLLLFENQLPFFILSKLFEMSEDCNKQYDDALFKSTTSTNRSEKNQTLLDNRSGKSTKHIIDFAPKHDITLDESSIVINDVSERALTPLLDRALVFFSLYVGLSCELNLSGSRYVSSANIKHLLGLVQKAMNPLFEEQRPDNTNLQKEMVEFQETKKLKDLVGLNGNEDWQSIPFATDLQAVGVEFKAAEKFRDSLLGEFKAQREEWKSIPNAIELQEAGVKFKKAETGNLFHIMFNNGVMEILHLNIVDYTEPIFRNLIAFEQHSQHIDLNYVIDFAALMDCLINTPKDVEVLR